MKHWRIFSILPAVIALSGAAADEAPHSFQPQTATVIGTVNAGTPIAFTQVTTQLAGELSMIATEEHFVNLVPNWPMLAKALLKDPRPVIAYTNISWADEILRVTCWIDRANSDLARGHIRVVLEATEGTIGSVAVGTVIAVSDGRLIRQSGMTGLTVHVAWTPGVFPDVLPTSFVMVTYIVPDLWKSGEPGRVSTMYTFTSIQPPDGSPPLVYTVREGIPVQ